ncbi:DUF2332 domain-containing protein [Phyllobacterium brassicacearum]|nr:DUF2332 domain-containing protein [Phyllobacterium brassicacearum]
MREISSSAGLKLLFDRFYSAMAWGECESFSVWASKRKHDQNDSNSNIRN